MILITAPVMSESGYGHKAREIVHAIIKKYGKDDVKIGNQPWGGNPETGLDDPRWKEIKDMLHNFTLNQQPDLHIHIGLPQKMSGKKNILFTSGVEVDRIPHTWIEHLNQIPHLDIVVPSNFVKEVFQKTSYQGVNKQNNQPFELKLQKPVHVISESYNDAIFNILDEEDIFKEWFNTEVLKGRKFFFSAGQITPDYTGTAPDRKNFKTLIEAYLEKFVKKTDVVLVLKMNSVDDSVLSDYYGNKFIDRRKKESNVKPDIMPSIVNLRAHLTSPQMAWVMSHPNNLANVYPTHGEGFGRMILESFLVGNRLIIPDKGAFEDFVPEGCAITVTGEYGEIPPEAYMKDILLPQSQWYNVNKSKLGDTMRGVYNGDISIEASDEELKKMQQLIKDDFSLDSVSKKIVDFVDSRYTREVKTLSLPNLPNKNKDLPKLKLPKLNKIK